MYYTERYYSQKFGAMTKIVPFTYKEVEQTNILGCCSQWYNLAFLLGLIADNCEITFFLLFPQQ